MSVLIESPYRESETFPVMGGTASSEQIAMDWTRAQGTVRMASTVLAPILKETDAAPFISVLRATNQFISVYNFKTAVAERDTSRSTTRFF